MRSTLTTGPNFRDHLFISGSSFAKTISPLPWVTFALALSSKPLPTRSLQGQPHRRTSRVALLLCGKNSISHHNHFSGGLPLSIDPNLVLVASDGMSNVFDYDPLIDTIYLVSRDCHYDTQEWLISRIAGACAAYTEITSIEVGLHKSPVRDGSGALGVRLKLNAKELADLR